MEYPNSLTAEHKAALQWFAERAGQEVAWPEPLNGTFLVNKAKGIHKPAGYEYALSIRQSLNGPYEDAIHTTADGRWVIQYAHEGSDPNFFTNAAVRTCLVNQIPVGVIVQTKEKPNSVYRVLGLGRVVGELQGVFSIEQLGDGFKKAEVALDVALPPSAFDASDLFDARDKTMRSIAQRRGQPAFRKALLEAYDGRCAITGCGLISVLEAANIIPYLGAHTNHISNGLLLRADIHTLFDLDLIEIDPNSLLVRVHPEIRLTDYGQFHEKPLAVPQDVQARPSAAALATRGFSTAASSEQ